MYNKLNDQTIREIEKIAGVKNLIIEEEKMLDYSHDEFPLPGIRKLPEVVVKPGNAKETAEIMKLANKEKVPVVPRGGATGLCGGCVPLFGGIVLSFENMNRVLEIDEQNSMAVIEPGGNVHTHLMKAGMKNGKLDEVEQEGWKEKYPQARKELHEDAKMRGGIISGEHGIGIAKKEYLSLTAGPRQIELMKQIKRVFDPNNILNPGKVFD